MKQLVAISAILLSLSLITGQAQAARITIKSNVSAEAAALPKVAKKDISSLPLLTVVSADREIPIHDLSLAQLSMVTVEPRNSNQADTQAPSVATVSLSAIRNTNSNTVALTTTSTVRTIGVKNTGEMPTVRSQEAEVGQYVVQHLTVGNTPDAGKGVSPSVVTAPVEVKIVAPLGGAPMVIGGL